MEHRQQRIVVGVDFERDGDVAFDEALRVAATLGAAELHVVHVLAKGERNTEVLSRALEAAMTRLRERLVGRTWPADVAFELRLHVRFGDIAGSLHQVAVDYDADLLVVGTHGRAGVARAVLGSVAEELVRTARLPVLVAREKNFEGLERTPSPDTRPTSEEDAHRVHIVSEAIRVGHRSSHISGLV